MMMCKIVYNRDYDEYVVKVWINGKRQKEADYFTSDKQDAKDTMTEMIKQNKS